MTGAAFTRLVVKTAAAAPDSPLANAYAGALFMLLESPGGPARARPFLEAARTAGGANAREAAEQCGVIWLPEVAAPEPLDAALAVRERTLALTEMDRPSDGYTMIGLLDQKHWDDPISEDPKAGSMEIWSFANATGDVHPMHLHLVQFQVLNRQPFDTKTYQQSGKLVFTGIPMAPESNERPAWKDTIKTYSGYVTRVIAKFDLPTGTVAKPGDEFRYVWHCHVLEHEDNEMMRPYKVVA